MELLRVVDKQGNNTNEILEREELHNRNKLHNEVTIYIINNNNEVLLQRRSKKIEDFSPDKLGVIAGHSLYNENPIETAIREVKRRSRS
ncbi:MAG: NUDIX hydrolase [Bacilli bacterium]|nr:MAG: NUDIX hydrolase [Bacilli bacterium]